MLVLLIWLIVLAVVPVCVFGFHDVLTSQDYDVMANSLYNRFTQPIWALFSHVNRTIKEILTKWENKELDLGLGCAQQLYQVLENLLHLDDGLWAYKMIDASGKFPSGLAEGNFVVMGSFDECLNIKSDLKNLTGNYCSITLDMQQFLESSPDNLKLNGLLRPYKNFFKQEHEEDNRALTIGSLPLYGICLPNKCSSYDIKNAFQVVTSIIPLNIHCQTKEEVFPPLDAGAILTIAFFGVVVSVMAVSTLIDYISEAKARKVHPVLISFSMYTNGKKLFKMHSDQGALGCINGIRFLSMCWVILGHVYVVSFMGPHVNLMDMVTYLEKTESMFFLNITHAVDTFFVLSGLLVAYNFMKKMKKGEKINIFKYYVHRYLRLTPAYAVVILCSIYLVKYFVTGPLYFTIDYPFVVQLCRDNWWKALLYLQNYLADSAELCVTQTWNLSIDYQLYLISPILLFLLYKMPRVGTLMTVIAVSGFMIAGFVVTYQHNLPALLNTGQIVDFMKIYYVKTHTRAATWFIGAWLGYFLGRIKFFNDKCYLRIPRVVVLIIWLVVLALIPVCVFGFHDVLTSQEYDVMANSLYNTFIRPIWALCVSWIIFACTVGYGGIINDFLSLPIFGMLSKLTYCMYLLHLTIFYMMISSTKMPTYFSVPWMMSQFCSLFARSFVLSIFWTLAFEMPILVLEPYIFGNRKMSAKMEKEVLEENPETISKNEVNPKVKNIQDQDL